MEYKFKLKFQIIYGFVTFLTALIALYFITNRVDLSSAFIIGFINLLVSGYFTEMEKCK